MAGFEVRPRVVRAAANDVDEMEIAVRKARAYAAEYVQRTWDGGPFILDAGSTVNDFAAEAEESYGRARRDFGSVAERLFGIARSYEITDEEQRRRYDRLLPKDEPYVNQRTHIPHEPGIDQADVDRVLGEPQPVDEGYRDFLEFEEKIGDLFKLGGDLERLSLFDIPNPVHGWTEDWEGTWGEMDMAANAMIGLADFWRRLGGEIMATASRFDGGAWSGNAADATRSWLNNASFHCIEHADGIGALGDEVRSKAQAMNRAITPVLDLANDLVGILDAAVGLVGNDSVGDLLNILKNPTDIFGEVWDRAKRLGDLIQRLWNAVDNVKKVVDAALLVFDTFIAFLTAAWAPSSVVAIMPSFDRLPPMTVGNEP